MTARKEPLDEEVAGAVKALEKAQQHVRERALDLAAALRRAVKEDRLSKKDAEHITRTFKE